ncbi:hypothetical protein JRQ81_008122 [Phrynocephalus forsythii]|uniref:Uncharacterized protein n=1 Tax=Phrynocephalus forsythii TaxID=171643 RepID=A0A9Q0XBU5_9SAUR|nr:hypothetical protein JRQ81_008122 [Phrynocephalus forsythii]
MGKEDNHDTYHKVAPLSGLRTNPCPSMKDSVSQWLIEKADNIRMGTSNPKRHLNDSPSASPNIEDGLTLFSARTESSLEPYRSSDIDCPQNKNITVILEAASVEITYDRA